MNIQIFQDKKEDSFDKPTCTHTHTDTDTHRHRHTHTHIHTHTHTERETHTDTHTRPHTIWIFLSIMGRTPQPSCIFNPYQVLFYVCCYVYTFSTSMIFLI